MAKRLQQTEKATPSDFIARVLTPDKVRNSNLDKRLIHWIAGVNSGTIGRKIEKLLVNFPKVQTSTQPEES
jgi:hypothetical protein